MHRLALIATLPLLASCVQDHPLISRPVIIEHRGGDTLYIDNGVCLLAYTSGDEEHIAIQQPALCGL